MSNCKSHHPLILITNDDGWQAAGIQALAAAVAPLGNVYIVAPDGPRSGAAASITPTVPVSFKEQTHPLQTHPLTPPCEGGEQNESDWQNSPQQSKVTAPLPNREGQGGGSAVGESPLFFSCTGTPVDCVKLACEQVLPRTPDLILSGINHGDNASVSVHYSGTMGAVYEGCMKGIPSIGLSLYLKRGQRYEEHPVGADTLTAIADLCRRVLQQGLPQDVCLNINIPTDQPFRGWRVCRQARGRWTAEWATASHPYGQHAFWLTGTFIDLEPETADTDFAALREGYCSIVPVTIDTTAHAALKQVQLIIDNV